VFERFTDRARRVLVLAQEEARLLGHDFIGTEHVLLGLIHEHDGIAAHVLGDLGITLDGTRRKVEERIGLTAGAPTGGPPFTPRAKKVLELSLREALQLGHNYIGTEHMLLGIVREGEGVAAQILVGLGADLPTVRESVIRVLSGYQGGSPEGDEPGPADPPGPPRCGGCAGELELVMRYRTMSIPPTVPDPSPVTVGVIYCHRCGHVISVSRAD
jgi:ATP-dependent Clp protease ATP-binding subunit ClpC